MQKTLFSAILCVCFSFSSVSLIWSGYCLCNFSRSHNDKEVIWSHHIGHIPMSSSCPRPKAQGPRPEPAIPQMLIGLHCDAHTHTTATTFCLLMNCIPLDCDAPHPTPQFDSTPLFSSRHKVSTWNKSFPSSKRDTKGGLIKPDSVSWFCTGLTDWNYDHFLKKRVALGSWNSCVL